MLNTVVLLLCLLFLVALGAAWYALRVVLPYSAIRPYRVRTSDFLRRCGSADPLNASGLPIERWSVATRDGIRLDALFIRAASPRATVIVMHGVSSSKEFSLDAMHAYHRRNLNVVAYDSRAHGASGGELATLGFRERYDVSDVVNAIMQRGDFVGPILIHGFSMGGAIALQAMAVDDRLAGGVMLGAFCNLRETMVDYMQYKLHVRWQWIANTVFPRSEELAAFRIDEVRPEELVRSIRKPVLLIHGTADEKIPVGYAHRNYANLGSATKELMLVEGAGHFTIHDVAGENVEAAIDRFVDTCLAQRSCDVEE